MQTCTELIVTYYYVLKAGRTINRESTYFIRVIGCLLFIATFLHLLYLLFVVSKDFIDCHTIGACFVNHHLAIVDSLIINIMVTFVVEQAIINRIYNFATVVSGNFIKLK